MSALKTVFDSISFQIFRFCGLPNIYDIQQCYSEIHESPQEMIVKVPAN